MLTKEIKQKFENSNDRLALLASNEITENEGIDHRDIEEIIKTYFPEDEIEKILENREFTLEKLKLKDYAVARLAKELISRDEVKQKIIKIYPINSMTDVIKSCSDEVKIKMVLEEEEQFTFNKAEILQELKVENLIGFFKENKEFLEKNEIFPFAITMGLSVDKQREFVKNIQNMNFTLSEIKEILVTLNDEVKEELQKEDLPEEYKSVLELNVKKYPTRVDVDLDKPGKYIGLDRLILINPEKFTDAERKKICKLAKICPGFTVENSLADNNVVTYKSTAKEFIEAEKWINDVINDINPKYSDAQKLALINNAIGKKISYSPDFDTEVFDQKDSRALWKIISSGYGVCNGIAEVGRYMLRRVGIESEIVSSGKHVFLKIKDIELPFADGRVERGDTLLDPTWDLMANRFNAKVNNFCLSYENLRKNDIDILGKDHCSHKNDEELKDITFGLDEKSLRNLFTSVNLAGKDGNFLITNLLDKSVKIDEMYADDLKENIRQQFLLLAENTPEFATCQNSTMSIIKDVLLNNKNMKFNKCVINRVYDRQDDEERTPVMYVYVDSDELGKQFYYADKEKGEFLELSQEDFEKKFECYDKDLWRSNRN